MEQGLALAAQPFRAIKCAVPLKQEFGKMLFGIVVSFRAIKCAVPLKHEARDMVEKLMELLPRYQMRGPIEAHSPFLLPIAPPQAFRAIKCAVPLKQADIGKGCVSLRPSALSNARSH